MIEQTVGVIGVGRLGSDVALTLAERDLCNLVLYDQVTEKAEYLASDLADTPFGHVYNSRISWATRMEDLASCGVVLVAAGARMEPGMRAEDAFVRNRELVREIADAFVGSSTLFVVASEPIDLMTAALRRELRVPPSRVLGIGGVVDSFRARHEFANALDLGPEFVTSHVIGPHSSAAKILWDFTSVNAMPARTIADEAVIATVEKTFAAEAEERLRRMAESFSRYAPAMAAFDLVRALVKDDRRIMSVTMEWTNTLGISDVAMSIPAVVGRFGADRVVLPRLDDATVSALRESATALATVLESSREKQA
ncbi:MAG: lactate/malate family dehydrogenase [Spirochaetota bacterium]